MATNRAGSGSYQQVLSASITPSAIPANSTNVETFNPSAWAAVTTDSWCYCKIPSLAAGAVVVDAQITATGTVQLTIENFTSSTITPVATTAQLLVF